MLLLYILQQLSLPATAENSYLSLEYVRTGPPIWVQSRLYCDTW